MFLSIEEGAVKMFKFEAGFFFIIFPEYGVF